MSSSLVSPQFNIGACRGGVCVSDLCRRRYFGVCRGDVQECLGRVSSQSVLQECHIRVLCRSALQKCQVRVSYKSAV